MWRTSPKIYEKKAYGNQPFLSLGGHGFQDYATLIADEAPIKVMFRNSSQIAEAIIKGKIEPRSGFGNYINRLPVRRFVSRDLKSFIGKEIPQDQEERLIDEIFKYVLGRSSLESDSEYIAGLYQKGKSLSDWETGAVNLIICLFLSPEFVFRTELGLGEKLPDGRRMLAPRELATAISFAFYDRLDGHLLNLANRGQLQTKADVERVVRELLYQKVDLNAFARYHHESYKEPYDYKKSRVLRFFHELCLFKVCCKIKIIPW